MLVIFAEKAMSVCNYRSMASSSCINIVVDVVETQHRRSAIGTV